MNDRARLDAMVGPTPEWTVGMVDAIGNVGRPTWDREVAPLLAAHWPEGHAAPKLRFLTCRLYAAGAFTALLLSPRRPAILRPVPWAGLLPEPAIARTAGAAFSLVGRVVFRDAARRVTLAGALIASIDHALDHDLLDLPADERGRRLHALLDGAWVPDHGLPRVVREVQVALERGLSVPARARYDAALRQCHAWVDAEIASLTGVEDPTGLCHRMAGIQGTIDGLAFPLADWLDPTALSWMVECSLFVQMADDWIDRDADKAADRTTPVQTGRWTFDDVTAQWQVTLDGLDRIFVAGGLDTPSLRSFARATYTRAMGDVLRAMATGTAA